MTIHQHRSRKLRRLRLKTPGGLLKIIYKKRKPSRAKCAVCKKSLLAVPSELPYKIKALSLSKRRPERPYGGLLCSKCAKAEIIKKARSQLNKHGEE